MNELERKCLDEIRTAKIWAYVMPQFELLAHESGVPDNWKEPGSPYTLETVVNQIESFYGIELFRHEPE